MTDLVTWLREQFDEDERAATRQQVDEKWFAERADPSSVNATYIEPLRYGGYPGDPRRVLAEVAAKRIILAAEPDDGFGYVRFGDWESCSDSCPSMVMDEVFKLLALPYADRPGYDPTWRPESIDRTDSGVQEDDPSPSTP
jgi:hypothetical protein